MRVSLDIGYIEDHENRITRINADLVVGGTDGDGDSNVSVICDSAPVSVK